MIKFCSLQHILDPKIEKIRWVKQRKFVATPNSAWLLLIYSMLWAKVANKAIYIYTASINMLASRFRNPLPIGKAK